MAFREINMDALNIRDFRVGRFQNGRYFISLANTLADGYVICFSKTQNPITLDDLVGCPQEFLNYLLQEGYAQYRLPSGEWIALRAVPRRAFDAMPTFSDFTTHPPERIQVWTMLVRPHMDIYVPKQPGAETQFLPAFYSVSWRDGGRDANGGSRPGELVVSVAREVQYVQGSLEYRVGEHEPIPLPYNALGQKLYIQNNGEPVIVQPAAGFENRYRDEAARNH